MTKISRRSFTKKTALTAAAIAVNPFGIGGQIRDSGSAIPLGGPLFGRFDNPEDWIKLIRETGYTAVYCPLAPGASSDEIMNYKKAASDAGIIIAEVGAWSNPISPDIKESKAAIQKCIDSLRLADEIEASCCVNISGSRNSEYWAGPHHENLTDETFEMVVETTRKIIDSVKPTRTWFTLEAMPWSFPHTPDAYLRLIKAIDRKRFAVHLDPVNMVTSPEIYFNNGKMIIECFRKLGPLIKSCHAKDIRLREDNYTPHLSEVMPGQGFLDYPVFLRELAKYPGVPLMMEHLQTDAEYRQAASYIRSVEKNRK
jgi:sugar phosphate isomerase/epimerase